MCMQYASYEQVAFKSEASDSATPHQCQAPKAATRLCNNFSQIKILPQYGQNFYNLDEKSTYAVISVIIPHTLHTKSVHLYFFSSFSLV